MIPTPSPAAQRPAVPSSGAAAVFLVVVAVLFVGVGLSLQRLLGEAGVVAAEWLVLLVPALLFVRGGGWDPGATLSLRAPAARGLVGGLVLVAGATPVGWFLAWLQTLVIPVPWEMLEAMERMLAAPSPGRLLWLLFAVALTPAICEEVVFRGVLLGATRQLAHARFLLLNGLVFGAFHLSVESPIRFLPTAWLGIVIAWAVWRTGSLWVGSLMHLANNGVIVLAAAAPVGAELSSEVVGPPPLWILPPALLALTAGFAIIRHNPGASLEGGPEPDTTSEDP